jgi:hypothetical protein
LGATAILFAAERHRKKTGKWPDSIAAIDRKILPNPPADPFTGEPFHLERRAGEFVIYSVGENGEDKQGEKDRKNSGRDDVVARAWDVSMRRRSPQSNED